MTTPLSVFTLIVRQTADEIFDAALSVARLVGLPVDTWRVGDPTRTLFRAQAEQIAQLDAVQYEYAKSGFLSTAEGDWLTLRAEDVYGTTRETSTFATSTITLVNSGGGYFELSPGGLVVSSSGTGATYENQADELIEPGATVEISVVAQAAGSGGSAAEDEIDTIVSPTMTGVAITASTVALGTDAQSDAGLREQCLATLGALSPNGPADAYEYVARNSELTGVIGVTRARSSGDNATGIVTLYVASTTSALSAGAVTAIQEAVDTYAVPLCTVCTVEGATSQTIAVTLSGVPSSAQDLVETTLAAYLTTVELGGTVARDAITSAVRVALTDAGTSFGPAIGITLPASDVTLAANKFPILGTVTLS
jgi:phage-related baseplate assembly protein